MLKVPTRHKAEAILEDAAIRNPGPWADHSRVVARTAQTIAEHHPAIDPQSAYVVGLLHDIGRREGVTDMRHVLDGYLFLQNEGFPDAARICLTHSFPIPFAGAGAGQWDCNAAELEFVQSYLDQIEYNPYDRLIQLCDALCLPSGPVLMEKRLMDVALRHGFNEYTLEKWQAFLAIQADFEAVLGRSIYSLLPDVVENTFVLDGLKSSTK